jgi:hypothetical protein
MSPGKSVRKENERGREHVLREREERRHEARRGDERQPVELVSFEHRV